MPVLGLGSPVADGTMVLSAGGTLFASSGEFSRGCRAGTTRTTSIAELCQRAGVAAGDVRAVVVAAASGRSVASDPLELTPVRPRPWMHRVLPQADAYRLSAAGALARLAAAAATGDALVFVGEDDGVAATGSLAMLRHLGSVASGPSVCAVAARAAAALGLDGREPLQALDDLAADDESPWTARFKRVLVGDGTGAIAGDLVALGLLLEEARADIPGPLDDPEALHLGVLTRRGEIAEAVCTAIVAAVADSLGHWIRFAGTVPIVVAGAWFATPRLTARVRDLLGHDLTIASAGAEPGRAIGAALSVAAEPGFRLSTLTLGASYTREDVKRTLDRCRIDYVYEASWERLLARIARLLAAGKQVAWFQGPADVGPISSGSRSVLTDPSSRYARDNLNGFLLRRRLDSPLLLTLTEEAARGTLVGTVPAGLGPHWSTISETWRARAGGVLAPHGQNAVSIVRRAVAPEFWDLLTACRRDHDTIGLVNVPLSRADGTLATTPAQAVSAFFSSPIDALVIDRFLTMKDYWLMRSDL
jgi:hypothetical protein